MECLRQVLTCDSNSIIPQATGLELAITALPKHIFSDIRFTSDASQWAGQSAKQLVFTFNNDASNRLGVGDVDRHG